MVLKMAEYIERTEELMLAMNAGARAIENTRRYHGAIYTKSGINAGEIGKTVFLSREEAEKALEAMKK